MRICLVHDDLIQFGGAEKLLLAMHEIWPAAPIYTSIYDQSTVNSKQSTANLDIKTSWMQKLPFKKSLRRAFFPLYPAAFESFDFSEFDVVLSSSTRFAHGVITKPDTIHICYSNAPTRFLWETQKYLEFENIPRIAKVAIAPVLSFLRIWDQQAAKRPDFWIANSKNVADKLKKFYRVDSEIIYPFVDLNNFFPESKTKTQDYFLVVSRLLAWKRIDIVVDAANKLKFPLKIVGTGPAEKSLKKLAGKTVEFLGEVEQDNLAKLYQQSRALILPQEEDFGITALEAQSCGKPVIAFAAGGVLETVIPGKTGIFFGEQTSESLGKTIKQFGRQTFIPEDCRRNAEKFSKKNFQKQLKSFVESHVKKTN